MSKTKMHLTFRKIKSFTKKEAKQLANELLYAAHYSAHVSTPKKAGRLAAKVYADYPDVEVGQVALTKKRALKLLRKFRKIAIKAIRKGNVEGRFLEEARDIFDVKAAISTVIAADDRPIAGRGEVEHHQH